MKIVYYIYQLGVGGGVERVLTSKVTEYLLGVSMFAMTSAFEGMPMTLLEAQTLGLPIVSYTSPCAPRDIVAEAETDYLVPLGDKELFAERLSLLIEDEQQRQTMGRAVTTAATRYQLEPIMQAWFGLFKQLLETK